MDFKVEFSVTAFYGLNNLPLTNVIRKASLNFIEFFILIFRSQKRMVKAATGQVRKYRRLELLLPPITKTLPQHQSVRRKPISNSAQFYRLSAITKQTTKRW